MSWYLIIAVLYNETSIFYYSWNAESVVVNEEGAIGH
jgi:hypothetical protein